MLSMLPIFIVLAYLALGRDGIDQQQTSGEGSGLSHEEVDMAISRAHGKGPRMHG